MESDAQLANDAGFAAASAAAELLRFAREGAAYPTHALEPSTVDQLAEALRDAARIEGRSLDLDVNRELAEMLGQLRAACERFLDWGKE